MRGEGCVRCCSGCFTVGKHSGTLVMGTAVSMEERRCIHGAPEAQSAWQVAPAPFLHLAEASCPQPSHTIFPGRLLAVGQGNTRGERSFTECALCLACPRALKGLNNRNHRQN